MNFISWGRPRIGSFCTAIRTRFRIQKFRIPFSLYQKFLVSQKVILARPKDTFSLRGVLIMPGLYDYIHKHDFYWLRHLGDGYKAPCQDKTLSRI